MKTNACLSYLFALCVGLLGCDNSSTSSALEPGEPSTSGENQSSDDTEQSNTSTSTEDVAISPETDAVIPSDTSEEETATEGEDLENATDDTQTPDGGEQLAPNNWGEELCFTDEDRGYSIGEVMAPLDFHSCDGEVFSTENLCGAQATWIFIVHAWCGECRQLSKVAEELAQEYVPQGVAIVQLLVHSYEHQLPTSSDCQDWAEEFGLEETLTLYDPLVKNIFLQESQQTGLSVFLDSQQRIVAKEHFYEPEGVRQNIDAILAGQR